MPSCQGNQVVLPALALEVRLDLCLGRLPDIYDRFAFSSSLGKVSALIVALRTHQAQKSYLLEPDAHLTGLQ